MTDTTNQPSLAPRPEAAFQQDLSPWNTRFLETALRDYEPGELASSFLGIPGHRWPTFVDTARIEEWALLAVSVRHLILTAGMALIPPDAKEIADLFGYSIERATLVARLLASREPSQVFASRGDFLVSESGLKCCEFDFGDVGLWHVITFNTMFRHSPVVEDFVSRYGIRIRERFPLETMVREILKLRGQGEAVRQCNFAILVPDDTPTEAFEASRIEAEYAGSLYQAALRNLGADGDMVFARAAGLRVHGNHASIDGKRIHVVMTQTPTLAAEDELWATASLLDLVERGIVNALNGPDCYALSNKIVIALLSEAESRGKLGIADAALVRATLPWTRRLKESTVKVKYRGSEYDLPELIVTRKDDFVLKPGEGFASYGVRIGRNTSPSDWERAVAIAFEQGTSVVQEAVGGIPIWLLGEGGYLVPHGTNIGIVICGDEYVGTFLRLMPLASVAEMLSIGYSLGAITGGVIEVEG